LVTGKLLTFGTLMPKGYWRVGFWTNNLFSRLYRLTGRIYFYYCFGPLHKVGP